jgi:hypothetical protein
LGYARRVSFRTALIALALVFLPAAPAAAAEVSLTVTPSGGVRLGDPTAIGGRVSEAGAPLAGRTVSLELRRHPFDGRWRSRGLTDTAADGTYTFSRRLRRNNHVRVRLLGVPPQPDVLSPPGDAFVLPAFALSFKQRGTRVLRLKQTYTVPRDVELSAPTRFYVGPCKRDEHGTCQSVRAPFRAETETRRVRAGRYVSRAKVRIPESYDGRFRYASCFLYSPGSGMGDPEQTCPREFARLR